MKNKRPFVFLSTAMTLDGKIAAFDKKQSEIADNDDKKMRLEDRIDADAVFIGAGQLRLDDPKLTIKDKKGQEQRLNLGKTKDPIKVAVVSNLSSIKNRKGDFFNTGEKKILFTTKKTSQKELNFFKKISDVYVYGDKRVNLKKAMEKLYQLGVRRVMVEGGGEVNFSLLKDDLVDEIHLKIGNFIFGGRTASTLVDGDGFSEKTAKKIKIVDLIRKENYLILKCRVK